MVEIFVDGLNNCHECLFGRLLYKITIVRELKVLSLSLRCFEIISRQKCQMFKLIGQRVYRDWLSNVNYLVLYILYVDFLCASGFRYNTKFENKGSYTFSKTTIFFKDCKEMQQYKASLILSTFSASTI